MTLAEKIVDTLLEGWFRDRIDDFKAMTGLGHDSFGLGKNTQKGWKPKYGKSNLPPARKPVPKSPPGESAKTWEIG